MKVSVSFKLFSLLVSVLCSTEAFLAKARISTSGKDATALYAQAEKVSGRNLKFQVDGGLLSYDLFHANEAGGPPIVYLPGLVREKNEAKAINLQALCKKSDLTFLSADYFGVGRSSGKFSEGTLTRWTENTIDLIDKSIDKSLGKVILVGHGVGAWISFLIALKRPDLVSGIVGLSADPDFTEELLWKTLPEDVKDLIMKDGVYDVTWGVETYPITRGLIEDGRKNLLLSSEPGSLPIKCPVRLVHSMADEEVPYRIPLKLIENCACTDASLLLLKGGDHAMEGEVEFDAMRRMIREVMNAFSGDFDLTSPGSG